MVGCASGRSTGERPTSTVAQNDRDLVELEELGKQGTALNRAGQFEDAARVIERALAKCRALVPADPALQAAILAELANSYVSLHQGQRARELIAEASPLVSPGELAADHRIYQLQMTLAESYRYDKRLAEAVAPFERAIEAAERHEAEMTSELVDALERLGFTLQASGREADGDRMLDRAYAVAERTPSLRGRARALAVRLVFKRATGNGGNIELLRRNGGVARMMTRYASGAVDIPLDQATSGGASSLAPPDGAAPASPPAMPAPAGDGPADLSVKSPPSPPSSGSVSNAAEVVASMRAGFRTCYQRALASDAKVEGAVRITLRIGADGQVSEAKAAALGLPVSSVDCLLERAMSGRFAPPDGGYAIIAVPVTFIRE